MQDCRRDCNLRECGGWVEDPGLADYRISSNTIRYMFVPPNNSRNSNHRYLSLVDCKVPQKNNLIWKENEMAQFIHSRIDIILEHAANFAKDYFVISADAMNKIQVGELAVSR